MVPFLDNEHWLGLDKIFKLTNVVDRPMDLRIIMEDFKGEVRDAYYSTFRIEDEVSFLNNQIV